MQRNGNLSALSRVLILFALMFGWLTWQGCGQTKKSQFGEKCLFNADCETDLRCVSGVCGTSKGFGDDCTNASECGGNLRCYSSKCSFGERKKCTNDNQCGSGSKCFESPTDKVKYCADRSGEGFPCGEDKDCEATGQTGTLKCSGGYCLKPTGEQSPCPDSESCLAPLVCSSKGLCVKPGQPGTGDVNDPCKSKEECQNGLTCDAGKGQCIAGGGEGQECKSNSDCKGTVCARSGKCAKKGDPGTADSGEACQKLDDCQLDLVCGSQGTCTPQGAQKEGGECAGTEQCAEGLACARKDGEKLGKCAKKGDPGTALAGEKCDKQADCSFPLACGFSGTCVALRPYQGTSCEDPKDTQGDFRVFFEIPRKDKEVKEFYRLPSPNDARKKGNGFLSYSGHANPGPLLGEDLVGKYIQAIESELKGFGTNQVVYFRFSKSLKFDTLKLSGDKPALLYINLTRGTVLGRRVRYNNAKGKYICHNNLAVRPFSPLPLNHGETYAVILTNVLRSTDGDAIKRDDDFNAMLSESPPSNAELKPAYDAYAKLREYLKKNATDGKWPAPNDVVGATVFTTQDPDARVSQFRSVIRDRPEPKLKDITLCDGKNKSPCEGGKDLNSRACGKPNDDFYELHAKIPLPIFQKGDAPYKDTGGGIDYDGSGKPKVARVEDVCVAITIPKKVDAPAGGWPVAIYAHGTTGNFRSHVTDGTAKRLSHIDAKDSDGKDVKVHYITLGIDQNLHGQRRGKDETDPKFLFFNFRNPQAALNNPIQAAVDHFTLVHMLQTFKIPQDKSPTQKEVAFHKDRLVYVGHSQGGVVGPLFLAYEPDIKVAVLSGAGGNLTQSMLNKTEPVNIAAGIRAMFGELQPINADHPILNLLQLYFDRNDPINYAHLIAKSPPKDVAPKHVYQLYGLDDAFTPPITMELLARALGVQQVGPTETSISGISDSKIDPPARGNLKVGGTQITATFGQYRPSGYDGHFVLFQHDDAKRHFAQFLGTFLADKENIPTHVK